MTTIRPSLKLMYIILLTITEIAVWSQVESTKTVSENILINASSQLYNEEDDQKEAYDDIISKNVHKFEENDVINVLKPSILKEKEESLLNIIPNTQDYIMEKTPIYDPVEFSMDEIGHKLEYDYLAPSSRMSQREYLDIVRTHRQYDKQQKVKESSLKKYQRDSVWPTPTYLSTPREIYNEMLSMVYDDRTKIRVPTQQQGHKKYSEADSEATSKDFAVFSPYKFQAQDTSEATSNDLNKIIEESSILKKQYLPKQNELRLEKIDSEFQFSHTPEKILESGKVFPFPEENSAAHVQTKKKKGKKKDDENPIMFGEVFSDYSFYNKDADCFWRTKFDGTISCLTIEEMISFQMYSSEIDVALDSSGIYKKAELASASLNPECNGKPVWDKQEQSHYCNTDKKYNTRPALHKMQRNYEKKKKEEFINFAKENLFYLDLPDLESTKNIIEEMHAAKHKNKGAKKEVTVDLMKNWMDYRKIIESGKLSHSQVSHSSAGTSELKNGPIIVYPGGYFVADST